MMSTGQSCDYNEADYNEAIASSFMGYYISTLRSKFDGPGHDAVMAFCNAVLEEAGFSPRTLAALELLFAGEEAPL